MKRRYDLVVYVVFEDGPGFVHVPIYNGPFMSIHQCIKFASNFTNSAFNNNFKKQIDFEYEVIRPNGSSINVTEIVEEYYG